MKCRVVVVASILVAGGCAAHKDLLPFLGKWSGGFDVSSVDGVNSEVDRKRERLYGYVQVYATHRKYKMSLEGEQETIDIEGTWTINGNRITLLPKSLKIDDKGGADKRDPNKKFIPASAVRTAYGHPLIFVESKDKKSLTGLEMRVGDLVGTHRLVKDSF